MLKDFIHYYLIGTKVLYALLNNTRVCVTGICKEDGRLYVEYLIQDKTSDFNGDKGRTLIDNTKPILRPMSDMNQDEKTRWNMGANSYQSYALRTKYFTDRYLDVFGLIKKGLAVSQETFDEKLH